MMNNLLRTLLLTAVIGVCPLVRADKHALVLQTDFGVKDGAVAAMKGVAVGVDLTLPIFDLSHLNDPYDIWQASYRLKQTVRYWPAGTVFVSVIDPGVGTERKSVVLKTKTGQFIVTPDNGTLTLVAEELGIDEVREIDEHVNRVPGSDRSYTFHGRDVYAYTGARLAAGVINFEQVGPKLPAEVVSLPYTKAARAGDAVVGNIPQLDFNYGNVWSNIPDTLFDEIGVKPGDKCHVVITQGEKVVLDLIVPYAHTFGDVPEGEPLLYVNSLLNMSLALNMGNFAGTHGISAGSDWSIKLSPVNK